METVNLHTDLLTSIFEKQLAISDLAGQLAHEYDDIKDNDRSKAVAIRDMSDKQQEHLNELEEKLDSISSLTEDAKELDSQPRESLSNDKLIMASGKLSQVLSVCHTLDEQFSDQYISGLVGSLEDSAKASQDLIHEVIENGMVQS